MVVIYVFAGFLASGNFFFTPIKAKIAELARLLRGIFTIHERYFIWLAKDPFKDCLEILNSDSSFDRNPGNSQLASLAPELIARDARVGMIYCQALVVLRRLFALVVTSNQAVSLKLGYYWLAQVPEAYIILISKNEPETLVVLAHYCVMIHQISSYWFIDSYAKKLLLYCKRNLSSK